MQKIPEMKGVVVSTGGGAMTFERNVEAVKQGSKIVFLDASFDVICERIGDNTTRPLFQDREKAKNSMMNARKSIFRLPILS